MSEHERALLRDRVSRARIAAENAATRARNDAARASRSTNAHREHAVPDAVMRRRATYNNRYARYLRLLELLPGERHAMERWTSHLAVLDRKAAA